MNRLLLLALVAAPLPATAQTSTRAASPVASPPSDDRGPLQVQTVRLAAAPRIDGRVDDAVWGQVPAYEGFRRIEQREGEPSSQRTVVRVGYDEAALYVAMWLYDTSPDSTVARLGRRDDDGNSDLVAVMIDPFLDRSSGYGFALNAAGTLVDGTFSNDNGNLDGSWDGVWEGKVDRFDGGWTAEMRIPFSQLRFSRADVQSWGFNVMRIMPSRGEKAMLRYIKESEPGFISRFPQLTGLGGVRPGLGFEVTPYATTRLDVAPAEPGNPFFDGTRTHLSAGADLKARLTSNLTLSATVNPDFGQVEVDPAEVNLSAFETFYQERRPFFVEGSSIFDFGAGPGDNNGWNWVNVDPFYSRRIGRAPQGGLPSHAYADVPEAARILAAGKLTGRVGATNVGVLSSLTGRAFADVLVTPGSPQRSVEVEPLTHYGVVRALRAVSGGARGIGVLGTATNRSFNAYPADADLQDRVNASAYTAGVDGWQTFDNGAWTLKGWLVGSRVAGTADRIAALQRSSTHFLQRPDRDGFRYDPTRTDLVGWGGRVQLVRSGAPWFGSVAFGAISPTLDVNDIGFIGRTDVVNAHAFAGYFSREEGRFLRQHLLMAAVAGVNTFDGDAVSRLLWTRAEFTFRNFWEVEAGFGTGLDGQDPYRTRGGPLMLNRSGINADLEVSTDSRKPWQLEASVGTEQTKENTAVWGGLFAAWQPGANLRLSAGPELSHSLSSVQWVRNQPDPLMTATYGVRHVFAHLDQWQASANIRMNWTFSPTMSLQLFAQPLVASGAYDRYRELARPGSADFTEYTASETNGRVTVDPDGTGAAPAFSFAKPDFRFASLRGNAVFRWEYRPGSTLFLVWTQQREDSENVGDFALGRSTQRLVEADARHVFALKFTYWLGR